MNLDRLKQMVADLSVSNDEIAMDQALSAIDLELFNLRAECFPARKGNPKLQVTTARDLLAKLGLGSGRKPLPEIQRRKITES